MRFLILIFDIVSWILIIRIFLSLFGMRRNQNRLTEIIHDLSDPILTPLQKIVPTVPVGNVYLDFAPLIALLLIDLAEKLLIRVL